MYLWFRLILQILQRHVIISSPMSLCQTLEHPTPSFHYYFTRRGIYGALSSRSCRWYESRSLLVQPRQLVSRLSFSSDTIHDSSQRSVNQIADLTWKSICYNCVMIQNLRCKNYFLGQTSHLSSHIHTVQYPEYLLHPVPPPLSFPFPYLMVSELVLFLPIFFG